MPRQLRPRVTVPALMHAAELSRPFHRHGWVYEEKYDGWRMVAGKVASQITLTSRNSVDHTQRFPELVKAVFRRSCQSFGGRAPTQCANDPLTAEVTIVTIRL